MQCPSMAAMTGAGKLSIAHMSDCPRRANSTASGPLNWRISLRSAPAEKFLSPAMINGNTGASPQAIFRISSSSAMTLWRVSRFIPSWEASVRKKTRPSRPKVKSID